MATGARCPARKIDLYSDTIGVVLDTVEGTEGAYTLRPNDLYVRAKIVKVAEDLKARLAVLPRCMDPAVL